MYPISLAFARTVHSVQGQTCEKLVYVMGKKVFNKNTVQQYEDWARSQGVTKIRAYAKEAQARHNRPAAEGHQDRRKGGTAAIQGGDR